MTETRNRISNLFNSLAFKIGFVIVFVEMIIFFATGTYYIDHFSTQLERTVEKQIKTPGALINQGVLTYEAIENKEILAKIIGAEIRDGLILGLNSRIFYSLNEEFKGQTIETIKELNFPNGFIDFSIHETKIQYESNATGNFLHCLSPLFTIDGKTPRFFVYLKLNTSWIRTEKQKLIASFTVTSVISILLTSVLIFLFFNLFVFSRLIYLAKAFKIIMDRPFDTSIDEKIIKSKDEIGVLAKAFKSMADKLRRTTTSIDNLNQEIHTRKETEERLRIAEEKYRKQFEGALDAILVIDAQTNMIIDCNPAASNLLERQKDEIIDQSQSMLYPEEKSAEGLALVNNYMQESIGKYIEIRVITKSGNIKDVGVRGSIFEVHDKKVIQGIFRDITDVKMVAKERKKLADELNQAQKLKSIGTLAAGIAHELNTPIQFIGDNVNFVQEETKNVFKVVKHYKNLLSKCATGEIAVAQAIEQGYQFEEDVDFSFIKEEFPITFNQTTEGIKRVATIVKAMKNFTHMGRNEKKDADINESIKSTIIVTRNEWKLIADIEKNLAPDLPLMHCYIADINQALMNLIVNAAHAIDEKVGNSGKKGQIYIETQQTETTIEIKIRDSGNGIPLDARDKIFDPFYTTKEIGKGTGQGLTLVYQTITEKHRGSISFDSEINVGTTFHISLPKNPK